MGTKYSSNSSSGYNATPPPDDGTVSEANKVKYSTIKTKLADPIKTLADTINSELATHFDNGPNNYTTSQTLGTAHYNQINQVSGSGVTLSLTAATTLAAGWYTDIVSTDTTNSVTLARLAAADTINGVSSDVTILPLQALRIVVNSAATGFLISTTDRSSVSGIFAPTGGIGPSYVQNIGLTSSVSAKALTVALKTKALADPSSGSHVQIAFRNATLTTGDYNVRSVTAATSVVAPNGATLGFAAGATGYIYVYALDNAGTVEAVISGTNGWDESTVQSTTAISASADSSLLLYSTTARTNVPIRFIGRIKITTGAVAGEWDNEDTELSVGNDYYHSGTWTPTLGGTATYNAQEGVYNKIGRLIWFRGRIIVNSIGTGSTTNINGLPFTASSGLGAGSIGILTGSATAVVSATVSITGSGTDLQIRSRTGASASDTTNAIFANGTEITFSGLYET